MNSVKKVENVCRKTTADRSDRSSNGRITHLEKDAETRKASEARKEESEKDNGGFEMIEEEGGEQEQEQKENSTDGLDSEIESVVDSNEAVDKKDIKTKSTNGCWQNFRARTLDLLNCPPLVFWVTLLLLAVASWSVIYSMAGSGFVPGSPLFSLIFLFLFSYVGGELIQLIKMPPLLGMLITGLVLRNVGFVCPKGVYAEAVAALREFALCIILIRAGLGLDPKALKFLKVVILRLACVPGLVEGVLTAIVTHFLLGLPWLWGMLSGAALAAVSPAVVIPCLFALQEKGYGTGKGIPTLVVAAASLDDILAITVFGVVLNFIYSTGKSLTMQLIQGPLSILMGIGFGVAWGFVARFFPHRDDGHVVLLRVLMIGGGGLMAVFGSGAVGHQGAGPLGCIVAAFVASLGWREQNYNDEHNPVADVFRVFWLLFQPILFGLIGSEVDVSALEASIVGGGLLALFCSLVGRMVVTVFIGFGAGFNWKEKVFISWAWFPKATVQAALGPLALDIARKRGSNSDVAHARKILVIAVLAILITAPIGAAMITTLGPRLLAKAEKTHPQDQNTTNRTGNPATHAVQESIENMNAAPLQPK